MFEEVHASERQTPKRPPPAMELPHEEASPPPPATPPQTTVGSNVAGSGVKAAKSAGASDKTLSEQGSETFDTASEASAGRFSARSLSSSDLFEDTKDSGPTPVLRQIMDARRHQRTLEPEPDTRRGAQITPREPERMPAGSMPIAYEAFRTPSQGARDWSADVAQRDARISAGMSPSDPPTPIADHLHHLGIGRK